MMRVRRLVLALLVALTAAPTFAQSPAAIGGSVLDPDGKVVVDAVVLVVLHRQRQLLLLVLWSLLLLFLLAFALGALELGIHLAIIKLQEGLSRKSSSH